MFLGYQDNKVVMTAQTREELETMPCIKFDRIEESSEDWKLIEGVYRIGGQTAEEQNKAIQQARQRAYEETSDNLFMEYQEALARGDLNADEKRLEWLASKDKVREDNPYILEEQETK